MATVQPQVEEYLQKFRDWEESFNNPAERVGYISASAI